MGHNGKWHNSAGKYSWHTCWYRGKALLGLACRFSRKVVAIGCWPDCCDRNRPKRNEQSHPLWFFHTQYEYSPRVESANLHSLLLPPLYYVKVEASSSPFCCCCWRWECCERRILCSRCPLNLFLDSHLNTKRVLPSLFALHVKWKGNPVLHRNPFCLPNGNEERE